jgi:hypothetical protein
MAKKTGRGSGWGRGRGKSSGNGSGTIGKNSSTPIPAIDPVVDQALVEDAIDSGSIDPMFVPALTEDIVDSCPPDPLNSEEIVDSSSVEDLIPHVFKNGIDNLVLPGGIQEEISDCVSEDSKEELDPPTNSGENLEGELKKSDWRGLFNSGQSMGNLHYFPPVKTDGRIYVSPPEEDVEQGIAKWKACLVGQFLDKPLPFFLVKKSVTSMWKQFGDIEVFSLENGLYLFRFQDEVTCEDVLEAKLWHVANKPLILRKWQPGMQVLKLTLSTFPIWIKLMNLLLEFWSHSCLSHVASGVVRPLYADKITEDQQRLGYDRVLVEVEVSSDYPKEIFIRRKDGEVINIEVEYPWIPPKCSLCAGFGHAAYACHKKEKKVWVPKGNEETFKVNAGRKAATSHVKHFDPTIRKPVSAPEVKTKSGGVRLSNSFEAVGRVEVEDGLEEISRPRSPTTFLDVFEQALSSKAKGKAKVIDSGQGEVAERRFSPNFGI